MSGEPIRLEDVVTLANVAEQLGAYPATVYGAAKRLGIAMPQVGKARVVPRAQVAAIAREISRRSELDASSA